MGVRVSMRTCVRACVCVYMYLCVCVCVLQVLSQRDMGMFQDVTTTTMDRGNSTLRGFTTAMSLTHTDRSWMREVPLQHW